jgi:hypothetical protein
MNTQTKQNGNFKSAVLLFTILSSLLGACGSANQSNSASDSDSVIVATTTLTSSSLSNDENSDTSFLQAVSNNCGEFDECITPDNIAGTIYYSGIMVGDTEGYSVGPIVGDVLDPSLETSFPLIDLYEFDFADGVGIDGSIVCCEGSPFPADEDAITSRIESYFGYIDTTFTLSEDDDVAEDLVGTHIVRTVYADIDGTDYVQGDMLYSENGVDFYWCTVADGCTFDSRPSDPIQYDDIVNYAGTPDGLGNQTIPTFSIDITAASQMELTETDLTENSWEFTVDFDMGDGVVFTESLADQETIADLVSIFHLAAEPGQSGSGFSATLSATATPL